MTSLINVKEGYKPIIIAMPSEVIEYGKKEQIFYLSVLFAHISAVITLFIF